MWEKQTNKTKMAEGGFVAGSQQKIKETREGFMQILWKDPGGNLGQDVLLNPVGFIPNKRRW